MHDEDELATDVCEAEEINESLSSNITKITQLLEIHETLAITKHVLQNLPPINTGTPLRNTMKTNITQLPHLRGLPLGHPVMRDDSFKISLLIGSDHYWDIVEDHIIRGNGPTAMSSKLGYLLSGPLPMEDPLNTTTSSCHAAVQYNGKECSSGI